MAALAGPRFMARPKGRPKTSTRNDRTARLDSVLLDRAEAVARSQKISLAEYLSERLRPLVDRDFARYLEMAKAELQAEKEAE